ncbi:amino acid permease [Cutaneotrichosporon oleaginosum]|uniref:Amino acid permease n=1 Tax=Cutaneotrichosporon oleaginosum TaxID=879819 RepID=A0A0J0XLD1_9TREE|nr:amino acid permease [Cutaneotrichosporon oleaginosum]KLT41895.1 amino acid permease [Cutaneotrichosporon oleaginosum]
MELTTGHGELEGGVKRQLKQRHMAMIAIGGAIGTGLFIGSGSALATGGPVGLWLGYCLMSTMVYAMMVALGEVATLFPVAGAFTHYGSRFVDPALGFAVGINYWYSWAITLPTELVAVAIVISYWDASTNPAVYITVCMVAIWIVNAFGARAYGEMEFWFSLIKVIAIIGLIILGIVLMCGGGPNHDPIGFRYWRNPGPFASQTINNGAGVIGGHWGQFLAFWNVFVQAAFSFIGTEIIGTTLGEAENPRKTVPKAIRRVFFRLVIFYVLGIFVISVLVPYDEPRLLNGKSSNDASASPFVIAIENAGIKGLPSVINAVILSAAWSAGNSDLYAASRTLYALSLEGMAPKFFRKCTRRGLPYWAIIATGLFGPLAYLNTGGSKAAEAFDWLYNLSAISGLLCWWAILLCYLRYYYGLKKQGLSRDSPYLAPWQPWLSWYGFIWFTLIIIFCGFTVFLKGNWDTASFFASYITVLIFAVAYFGWKIVKRTKIVKLEEIDYITGRRQLDEMEKYDNERYKPVGRWGRIASWLF